MIIGLVGFKQSGKSTAATHLEKNYGFVRLNFKDGLIAEMKQNFPDVLRQLAAEENMTIDELFATKPPVMRALMMNYGTEVVRKQNPDHWVLQWKLTMIDLVLDGKRNIVCDDVRFLNEARAIKSANGVIIRLVRTDITTGGDHKSETEQLQIVPDHTITVGPGEHEELYTALDTIVQNYAV
jgi:hypothetical protein